MYSHCTYMTRFNFRINEADLEKIKKRAKKERISTSGYIKRQVLTELENYPNLSSGNWWDNPEQIIKKIEEAKKKIK